MPPDGADSKKDALAGAMAAVTSQTEEDSSTGTTAGAKDGEAAAEMDDASALAGRLTNHKSPPCANDSPEKCLVLANVGGVGSCCCWEFRPHSEVKKNTLLYSKKIKRGGGM